MAIITLREKTLFREAQIQVLTKQVKISDPRRPLTVLTSHQKVNTILYTYITLVCGGSIIYHLIQVIHKKGTKTRIQSWVFIIIQDIQQINLPLEMYIRTRSQVTSTCLHHNWNCTET
jgi:hypothetical protein